VIDSLGKKILFLKRKSELTPFGAEAVTSAKISSSARERHELEEPSCA